MFRVKICGVTTAADAELAASLGADAVGINFFRGSKRFVAPGEAPPILAALRGKAEPVAVFVNEAPRVIEDVCRKLGIGIVQLSGNETAETAGRIALRKIKAIRFRERKAAGSFHGYPCEAFLVDADVPGEFGGTGVSLDWNGLKGLSLGKPWILAGGLTPENVLSAIRQAEPDGVDVAGGVESRPGKKDGEKMKRFIANARKGFGIET